MIVSLISAIVLAVMPLQAGQGVPFRQMQGQRLPELNVPRKDHAMMAPDGESLTLVGGHTTGFIPERSLETYRSGRWEISKTIYTHDAPVFAPLGDGRYFIAGGYSNYLGVGQTPVAEIYDPSAGSVTPAKMMDRRRAQGSAALMPDGGIIISGNWYWEDCTEYWTPATGTYERLPVSQPRCNPYILLTSADNAIIFSTRDTCGHKLGTILVDRLRGEPYSEPFFETWRPLAIVDDARYGVNFVGDAGAGDWSYLVACKNSASEVAIAKVSGGKFSLLAAPESVPREGPHGEIYWSGAIYADAGAGFGYLCGNDADTRFYLLKIDWSGGWDNVSTQVFYCEEPIGPGGHARCLLSGGRMAVCGGASSNYEPSSVVYIFDPLDVMAANHSGLAWLIGLAVVAIVAGLFVALRSHRRKAPGPEEEPQAANEPEAGGAASEDEALMEKVRVLMEEKQFYRRKGLKMSDVASALGTNTKYVSSAINSSGTSFVDFVNGYRIRHAMEMLSSGDKRPLSDISEDCGFASEVSFFRHFKKVTGQTPSQWMAGKN